MFKLDFHPTPFDNQINLRDKILMMGSCFSESIGHKLAEYKMDCLINPFGTIYNPYSIFLILENALTGKINTDNFIEIQGVYHYWNAHSQLSALSPDQLKLNIKQASRDLLDRLEEARWIILTHGTSFVYTHLETKQVVANCHKVPSSQFGKSFLNARDLLAQFSRLNEMIYEFNPDAQFLFTVSPVRHIKDGLIDNNRSKSILIDATHQIISKFNNCHYFPSYEIMIDELRDYRFYDRDLVHPNSQAIDYIWKQFIQTTFDEETTSFIEEWSAILKAIRHKPFHPESQEHQNFLREIVVKLSKLQETINVSKELTLLEKQLII